ncbi:MAG: flagellar basal body P-ring formation protein FlgA [bacterium]|nr:flagellar basal body P-ring formation protein FlgA [bacterium]
MHSIFSTIIIIIFISSGLAAAKPDKSAIADYIKKQVIRQVLDKNSQFSSSDIKISIQNKEILKYVPENTVTCKLDIRPKANLLGKTVLPLLFYSQKNNLLKKTSVIINTNAYTNFARTTKTIKRGTVLSREHIVFKYEPFYGKPVNCLLKTEDIIGKEAFSTIPKNALITEWLIRDIPDIRSNDKITIVLNKNNLELRVGGIALENGYIGDNIRIRTTLKERKLLEGTIIAPQCVKIFMVN